MGIIRLSSVSAAASSSAFDITAQLGCSLPLERSYSSGKSTRGYISSLLNSLAVFLTFFDCLLLLKSDSIDDPVCCLATKVFFLYGFCYWWRLVRLPLELLCLIMPICFFPFATMLFLEVVVREAVATGYSFSSSSGFSTPPLPQI